MMANPFTRPAGTLVDEMIGTAYPVVKTVAGHLKYIKRVYYRLDELDLIGQNMVSLITIYNSIPQLTELVDNLEPFQNLLDHVDDLVEISTQLEEILAASENAINSANKAQQWAENPFNDDVEPGLYSAKHWATVAGNTLVNIENIASVIEGQATFVDGKADEAAASALAAAGSASDALASEGSASASAGAALTYRNAAETFADNAATAQSNAETAESQAEAAAVAAQTAETNAETAQGLSEDARDAAITAKNNAETAETNAETAYTNSVNVLVDFEAKYLGAKALDPALDNAGLALIDGAFYWNTVLKALRFYDLDTTTWTTGVGGGGGGEAADILYDPTGTSLVSINVQDAINELDGVITPIKTKTDFISITQAVDLDAIEARVNSLDAAVVLRGNWDASSGVFPGGGTAQAGDSFIVSVAGTVNAISFSVNDRIIAIADNASTTTFAANWLKADYTDQVLSVAGKTGAVTLVSSDVGLGNVTNAAQVTLASGQVVTGRKTFKTSVAGAIIGTVTSGLGEIEIQAEGTGGTAGAAIISFHRPSSHAMYVGLDTDNKFKRGGWSLGANAYEILDQSNMNALIGGRINNIRIVTNTTDTLVLADAGKYVYSSNASPTTITVPTNAAVAFPVNSTVINLGQYGAGQLTIVGDVGVTIRAAGSRLKMAEQYGTAALVKIGADEWWLFGNLAA